MKTIGRTEQNGVNRQLWHSRATLEAGIIGGSKGRDAGGARTEHRTQQRCAAGFAKNNEGKALQPGRYTTWRVHNGPAGKRP